MSLLREHILRGQAIATAGPLRAQVAERLLELGAALEPLEDGLDQEHGSEWARSRAPLHGLVLDAAAPFGDGGRERLELTLQSGWTAIAAVATGALVPAAADAVATAGEAAPPSGCGAPAGAASRILLIAPPPAAGPHAGAIRAALENLARTLATG